MAGGDKLGAENLRIVEKDFEFDFAVAEDIRIGGAASAIFIKEMFKHVIPVVGCKVGGMQGDLKLVADLLCIGQISHGGAVLGVVVFIPVFHKQAFDLVTLFN